jgi:hypothetical protein
MQKSWLDLIWPAAGIDRSTGYQRQPPYTTPDAVNVRTQTASELRQTGGSRPGLGLSIRTELPGPIRLLTKVSVLKTGWTRTAQTTFGTQLRDYLIPGGSTAAPSYSYGYLNSQSDAYLYGPLWERSVPIPVQVSNNGPYEISMHIRPKLGKTMVGTAKIHFGLASTSSDTSQSANTVSLTFTAAGYSAKLTQKNNGSTIATLDSTSYADASNSAGVFSVQVTPGTSTIKVYWRGQQLLSTTVTTLFGRAFAFGVVSPASTIQVTHLSHDFENDPSVRTVPANPRRDLLVAVSQGNLYVEDTVNTLKQVTTNTPFSPAVQLCAVDREQKLFIADYGVVVSGETGTIDAGTGFDELETGQSLTGLDTGYVLEILDSDYSRNTVQTLAFANATGGTFKLSFKGAQTAAISYPTNESSLAAALIALNTVGTGNCTVINLGTGGTQGPYKIMFRGTLAGKDQPAVVVDTTTLTGSSPSASVSVTQVGAGGTAIAGTYNITDIDGTVVTFNPALNLAGHDNGTTTLGYATDIGSVVYRIARQPKVYDPKANTVEPHYANVGVVPAGCRLVALYRDRIVYAGSDLLPHVWYMSRQGDPFDWDYGQEDSGSAVFAENSTAGQLADPITAMIPHGDECLVFGSYNSLWIMRGDPGYGGTLDALSRKIGIVSSNAWTRSPDDMLIFLSADGLYVMSAGCSGFPTSLSRERLPDELLCLNPEREAVSLEYDTLARGVHIFVTRLDGSEGSHWWFDWFNKAFWRVRVASGHEPYCLHERTVWDDCPAVLLGGRDGKIRQFDRDNQVDDGNLEIDSYCVFGPFHLDRQGFQEGMLSELQGSIGRDSGAISWEVTAGNSAEESYYATTKDAGTWDRAGLNYNTRPRVRGVSAIVKVRNKLGSKRRWFLERVTAVIRSAGRRRIR